MTANEKAGPHHEAGHSLNLHLEDITQRGQIERMLHTGQQVCGADLLDLFIPRYAAIICALRARGWQIVTERCENERHRHRSGIAAYRLEVGE